MAKTANIDAEALRAAQAQAHQAAINFSLSCRTLDSNKCPIRLHIPERARQTGVQSTRVFVWLA
jgi:hypothetical protein